MIQRAYTDVKIIGDGLSVLTAIRPDLPDLVEGSMLFVDKINETTMDIRVVADPEEHVRVSDHIARGKV